MVRELYTCAVCGKTLKLAGTRNIELHERSAFHKAAMKQENKPVKIIKPVSSIVPEIVPEIKGIQTTVMENNNVKNKETKGRINNDRNTRGREDSRNDSDGSTDSNDFDGYLC